MGREGVGISRQGDDYYFGGWFRAVTRISPCDGRECFCISFCFALQYVKECIENC